MPVVQAQDVVSFWAAAGPGKWWAHSPAFDAEIRTHFGALHGAVVRGAHQNWTDESQGALALVLILDQFSRNLYRDDARAFAQDEMARTIAGAAIARAFDRQAPETLRTFLYMPYMHAEDLAAQDWCITLLKQAGALDQIRFAQAHRDVIARFGRFPHRNAVLGRRSTAEEQAYLFSYKGF